MPPLGIMMKLMDFLSKDVKRLTMVPGLRSTGYSEISGNQDDGMGLCKCTLPLVFDSCPSVAMTLNDMWL